MIGRQRVLAIDVGSSAVRAAIIDASGTITCSERISRSDGGAGLTFDAEQLWNDVCSAVLALPRDIRGGVAAIGIAGHIGTVFVDATLRPVGHASGWADSAGIAQFASRLGEHRASILLATGRPALSGGGVAASLAFRSRSPSEFATVALVLAPKDFLTAKLTGDPATDQTSAAYTGASRVADRAWDATVLTLVDLDPSLFPRQIAADNAVGTLLPSMAASLGLPSTAVVVAGGPDGSVGAAFVLGAKPGAVADVAGTTDVLVRLIQDPVDAPVGAVVNPFLDGIRYSAGGATGMTGGAFDRWAQLLGLGNSASAMKQLEAAIAGVSPGAAGLSIDPSLSGSRFPNWDSGRRGSVSGLDSHHRPEHFLRAVAEGAAYVVREGVDLLTGPNQADTPVVLAGGAARSPLLAQLRADVLGRETVVCDEPDVSLIGAGLLAQVGAGLFESSAAAAEAAVIPTRVLSPDVRRTERYSELYHEWRER